MLKVGICDDDSYVIEQIHNILKKMYPPDELIVEGYKCGEAILGSDTEFDLVFLDVEMGRMNGIQTGYELKKRLKKVAIIIITSHDFYLDEAMDLHVFRFLSKPIDEERLIKSLNVYQSSGNKAITFINKYKTTTLLEKEIVCVYAMSRKTWVLDVYGKKYETTLTLKSWCEMLGDSEIFSMPHNSFIVNLNSVARITGTLVTVRCNNGYEMDIYASRRKISDFRDKFYMKMRESK